TPLPGSESLRRRPAALQYNERPFAPGASRPFSASKARPPNRAQRAASTPGAGRHAKKQRGARHPGAGGGYHRRVAHPARSPATKGEPAMSRKADKARNAKKPPDQASRDGGDAARGGAAPEGGVETITLGGKAYRCPWAGALRALTQEERDGLKEDIRRNGVKVPVVVSADCEVI